ncbi:bifunctional biotin--[acetyl-CoA-carboxylase] synthetase/biotin operon repressor [compost metagenome]
MVKITLQQNQEGWKLNKTERQLAILLELQRSKVIKGEELAEKLETSVRTIYRDIQALSESGVPIIGAPGQGYSLIEGYFLPPVSFTVEEAVTLLLGAEFIEQQFDHQYLQSAQSSRGKIEVILPDPIRHEADRIRSGIRFRLQSLDPEVGEREKTNIKTIRTAMMEGKKIHFKYTKRISEADNSRETIRTAAPLGLVLAHTGWLLVAQCDLRGENRHFKISRMSNVSTTIENFELPRDFNFQNYKPTDNRQVTIRAVFKPDIADKVDESKMYFMDDGELLPDGYYVNFRVRYVEELLSWILSWGADVQILEPESFRHLVKNEVERMLKNY